MEHEDYIDQDEGFRPIDWDSHLREPFFAEALPCESCGAPCDERRIAPWDTSLQVGPCCYHHEDLPLCDTLWNDLSHCQTVEAVAAAMEQHVKGCLVCQGGKKGIAGEQTETPDMERAA